MIATSAITAIKIENFLHEFSSLAGVREDVTDMVLNIKQIALAMEGEGPKRPQLAVTGPAEVNAGMIATSGDIAILNPELVIRHLDESANLNMELAADTGKGSSARGMLRHAVPRGAFFLGGPSGNSEASLASDRSEA